MQNLQAQDITALHYSSVFTVSADDFFKLKEMVVASVDKLNKIIEPSKAEELVCFSCDLFHVKFSPKPIENFNHR